MEMPKWLKKKTRFADAASRVTFWRKCGPYLIVHEKVSNKPYGGSGHTELRSAYSPEGLFIGSTREGWRLWKKYGITRFFGGNGIAYVGQSGKFWHGWSHRAISRFAKGEWKRKGHMPHEGRSYRITHPRTTAFAFAKEVS